MSAGDGYKYLLKSVATGDGDRALSTPLTRYYLEVGTPPGRWIGSGLSALGPGNLKVGARVTEEQLQRLIGLGRDPLTGAPLGRAYPVYRGGKEQDGDAASNVAERTEAADGAPAPGETPNSPRRRAVAGFDFTFSVPKSASVLWAVADARTQEVIVDAHHAAVADVLAMMERELAATRVGVIATDGAVAQVPVEGLIATAFDHFDSRAGDPHLHTHVVISNKVKAVLDGGWRSLDGRPLHAATVALSELHEALFADRLTRELGVAWEQRERGRDRNLGWSISAVSESLAAEFSSRTRDIEVEKDRLIDQYLRQRGRQPSSATLIRLRQQATLATRPQKQIRPLADLTAEWRARASGVLGEDASRWARSVPVRTGPPLQADDISMDVLAGLGLVVLDRVGERRSTWRRWNLYAEAARQTMGWRFASTADREEVVAAVVAHAERASVQLTPPELTHTPLEFQRSDGSSVFRPHHSTIYSSASVLAAEDRLLLLASDVAGPTAATRPPRVRRVWLTRKLSGLTREQVNAVTTIATSGRFLDVLVGPAGAGKTTAMSGLRSVWEATHGASSVVGLAPSAAAAQILGEELGIRTENTAMWLQLHQQGRAGFSAGQLVILDEASLAGTSALDRISQSARQAGAKVLLVGDGAQLSAIEAGGAFAMLAAASERVVELTDVRRFVNDWEREASLGLRDGRLDTLETYLAHDRVRGGTVEDVLDSAYEAWRADVDAGSASILVASDSATVSRLNQRARADLVLAGVVDASQEVRLHDETHAGVGDTVITRRNDRRLRTKRGWVRNGDRWQVLAVRSDGSLLVQAHGGARRSRVILPAHYAKRDLDLGYAVTTYRAQGVTTGTSHVLVNSATTREQLYVALTRGRHSNTAYVASEHTDEAHSTRHPADEPTPSARSVLAAVLQHVGAEASAHQTLIDEQENWGSIAQLAAEYETIAAAAQHPRWSALIRTSGLSVSEAEAAMASPAFGALSAALRRAEADGHDVDQLMSRLVGLRDFLDADDPAAVLHARLDRFISVHMDRRSTNLGFIAGLLPIAFGPMSDSMRTALGERHLLMEQRAAAVLDRAIVEEKPWIRGLIAGARSSGVDRVVLKDCAMAVAAFRDRYDSDGACSEDVDSTRRAPSAADLAAVKRAVRRVRDVLQRRTLPASQVHPIGASVSGAWTGRQPLDRH